MTPVFPPRSAQVRFGDFRLDLASGELCNNGHKTLLQDKPLKVLLALLERPGEIVSRDELKKRLWSSDTFVDFDLSLNKAVNRLRDSLNDSADKPLFVETLPRKGYRWIGPAAMSASTPIAISENNLELDGQYMRPEDGPRRRTGWLWKLAVGLPLMVVALTFAGFSLFPHHKVLTDKDSILVADFQNSTGNPVFTETLKQALITELAQSPLLNVVPPDSILETLRFMGRSPGEKITPAIAREICQRNAIRAVLRGSISNLGRSYVITLDARDCLTGFSLGQQDVMVETPEQTLHGLARATANLRRQLGESLNSIQKFGVPLERATTSSLEALQAYSFARGKLAQGGDPWDAIPFLRRARELDPNFAMAHIALGEIYASGGPTSNDQLAAGSLEKAFSLRDRVSERERLYITSAYYEGATRELYKAADAYQLWKFAYPKDASPLEGLRAIYISTGEYQKAIQNAQAALLLSPERAVSLERLATLYMFLGRPEAARDVCERSITQGLDGPRLRWALYMIDFLLNDMAGMQQQLSWAQNQKQTTRVPFYQALLAGAKGQLRQARTHFQETIDVRLADHDTEGAALAAVQLALIEAHFGYPAQSRLRAASSLPSLSGNTDLASLALAMAGDDLSARKPLHRLLQIFPRGTLLNNVIAPVVEAQFELKRNQPKRAIEVLRSAETYELGADNAGRSFIAIYVRGKAYLQMSAGKQAETEFQKIIDHPGIAPFSPLHALAFLGRARAYGLQGDPTRTRAAYEEFFARWKDADGDLPIMVQARAEYRAASRHALGSSKSSQNARSTVNVPPTHRDQSSNLNLFTLRSAPTQSARSCPEMPHSMAKPQGLPEKAAGFWGDKLLPHAWECSL